MSDMRMVMLTFLIIATCGSSRMQRMFAWTVDIVCVVVMLTVWLASAALGIEVEP